MTPNVKNASPSLRTPWVSSGRLKTRWRPTSRLCKGRCVRCKRSYTCRKQPPHLSTHLLLVDVRSTAQSMRPSSVSRPTARISLRRTPWLRSSRTFLPMPTLKGTILMSSETMSIVASLSNLKGFLVSQSFASIKRVRPSVTLMANTRNSPSPNLPTGPQGSSSIQIRTLACGSSSVKARGWARSCKNYTWAPNGTFTELMAPFPKGGLIFSNSKFNKEMLQRRFGGTSQRFPSQASLSRTWLPNSLLPLGRMSRSIILFSQLLSPWTSSSLGSDPTSLTTWNARALLHHKPRLRASKIRFLLPIALRSTITALQEVHGSEAAFRTAIPCANTAFHIFSSFMDNPNEGWRCYYDQEEWLFD